MSFFSDVRETSVRYGGYVAEFKELFRKNEMRFGKSEDFLQLAPKLAYHSEFRTAFAGLTESVRKREDGKLTLTRMLTIIAIAMGGPEIEALGSASVVPVSLVVVFLAGVGGWSETEPEIVMKAPQEERNERIESQKHLDQIASRIEPPPDDQPQSEGDGRPMGLLEQLAAIEASFRARKPSDTELVETDASNVVDNSAVESMLRAAELEKADPTEDLAPFTVDTSAIEAILRAAELEKAEPIEDLAPFTVDTSAIEAILRAAELEKAEPTEVYAPLIADRYKADATRHEPPEVEALPIAAPVVIAKYESVRVQRPHKMITVLGVLLFLLVGFGAALLYRDQDWRVQTLVKNGWANAASFASDGKVGLPSHDRGGGTSNNVPQSKRSRNLGQDVLSGGRAKGPTDAGSNRKVEDRTVVNHAQARGRVKQPPALDSAPAKIPSTKQEALSALAATGQTPFSLALILLALLWVPTAGGLIVANLVKKQRTDPTLIVFGFALLVLGLLQVPSGAWQTILTWR